VLFLYGVGCFFAITEGCGKLCRWTWGVGLVLAFSCLLSFVCCCVFGEVVPLIPARGLGAAPCVCFICSLSLYLLLVFLYVGGRYCSRRGKPLRLSINNFLTDH
jgi:hypothetical protein